MRKISRRFKSILITKEKGKKMDLLTTFQVSTHRFPKIHVRPTNKKCENDMLPSKLGRKSAKTYPKIRRKSCEKSKQERMQDLHDFF